MKRNPLFYVILAIMFICFVFLAWPNILGWNTNSVWVIGMPVSQFCIYLFPLLIAFCMGGLYLLDLDFEKRKARAKVAREKSEGGDKSC